MPRGKPHDVEASAGVTCQYPGPTLLPSPIAHAVSLATRSTSLAIRIGSLVGCYSLDAARFTTLSSLGLARSLVETVLSTAARDTVSLSQSDLGAAETETILERSLESLHFAVTQIVFWTSAGFRLTGTTISTASDASQLLLGSLDKLFGSTDSSRAVASIITLVRREFNNPATGVGGEKVGVSDLVVALGALAYLQRASRRQASEEARRHAYEEVIWDVVVLTDGERIDVRGDEENERQLTPRNDHDPNDLGIRYGAGEDDEAVMQRLKSHITANLEPGTTASISNSVSSVQTITVDVKGPQLLSLPTPPGAEIVETRSASASAGNHRQWSFGPDKDTSYTVVYRIQRDKFRSATFRGEEEESGPAVVEVTDDDPVPTAEPLKRLAPASKSLSDITSLNGKESQRSSSTPSSTAGSPSHTSNTNGPFEAPKPLRPSQSGSPETTANQKKQRTPPIEPLSPSSSAKKRTADSSRRSQPKKKAETLSTGKQSEKRPGLKQVLKDSGQSLSNMWNKEGPDHEHSRSVVKQRPQWKGTGGSTSESSNKLKPPAGRTQPQKAQRNVPARRVQTPDPFPRPSSRASYVSIHERRRDSVVSLTDAYSRNSTTGLRPASPTIFRTDYSTQETVSRTPGEPYPIGPVPPSPHGNGHHHRRSTSYAPSLYSLATNDSQTSLLLASYYQKSAYNTSSALNTLRNEGFVDGTFPTGHLLPNIARYMRYSSACYGSHFMKLLGISNELPASQMGDRTHQDVRHFVHHTESEDSNILLASFVDPQGGSDATGSTGTGVPLVHYISLDHEAKAVVLACRGTLGFEDVLADLTCDYDNLLWRGRAYRVHKGVHASARRLLFGDDGRVLVTLKEALLEFPDYGLVLCGHSLGGGVTSLLGVMLSEPNPDGPGFVISAEPYSKLLTQGLGTGHKFSDVRLPQSRRIHVYAYGPPGILSPSLRKITRGLITTVVHGNDIVPHLSLGVLHDFQGLALAFKRDENQTKAEIRRRMWQAFQGHLSDKWYQTTPAAPKEGDEEWVLPMLQALRGTMKGKKLVPPGEVFAIETTRVLRRDAFVKQEEGPIGRPARRVVLKYIRDVEGRFDEIRFGAGLLTDHSPAKYEDALNKLRLGVVE
ncbi:Sn1-specific diacylglycerol lipase beta [Metarhizium anisopliae]|nr:Sn1-specific diacylglycerol lipase beta [Metarhizium anisopliae]